MCEQIGLIVFFICILVLSVLVHEIAHAICGIIIGLKFVGFKICNLIINLGHRIKVRRIYRPKSWGSCFLVPKAFDIDINWKRIIFMYGGGIFVNLLFSLIGFMGIIRFYGTPSDKYYAIIFMINFVFTIFSSTPYTINGGASDGYWIYHLCKLRDTKSYIKLLYISGNLFLGNVDTIENIFKVPTDIQSIDDFDFYIWNAYFLMKKKKFIEAKQMFFNIYHNKFLPEFQLNYIKCELLWLAIVLDDKELQTQLMTKEMNIYLSTQRNDYAALRVRYLIDDKKISIDKYEKMYAEILRQEIFLGRACIEEELWAETKLKKTI